MTTLFAQILPMFTGQTERAATEALRHILQQSASARQALEGILRDAGVDVAKLTRFQTEVGGENGERVDLVCSGEDGGERVLLEAKFWAGLTDNQPNTYLARLPEDGHSALLFVAPAQRMETLWPVLCARAATDHDLTVLSDSGEIRISGIGTSARKMVATSWRTLLEAIKSRASLAGDETAVRDVEQLLGLTEREDSGAFLPIHEDELGEKVPRRMINFANLVHNAVERAVGKGWADTSGLRVTPQWYGDGRYLRLHGVSVWFGINIQQWSGHGLAPLWVQSQDNNQWYPIAVRTGVEYDEVLDYIVEQMDTIGQNLKLES